MLQIIRDWVTGWLAVLIVILLIIPFAFWGINYYFDKGGEPVAARINGEKITVREFQQAHQRLRQQLQSLGTDLPDREALIKKQALDGLINTELLRQFNADLHLRVSDTNARDVINNIEVFQGADGFDNALYERYLSALGYTPATFEAQIRQDMTAEQLQAGIMESAFVIPSESENIARLNNQTRDISYLLISYNGIKQDIEISDQEIQEHYDMEDQLYMEPEKVRLAYLDLSLDKIKEGIDVTEESLRNYYTTHVDTYGVQEQRSIKQILFPTDEKTSDEMVAKIEAKAKEVEAFLKSGKTFKDVTEKYADETEIKMDISEYGYLAKGILEPPVDSVAFSLNEGEISEPVKTDSGFHIVMVEDIKGGEKSTFEEVREQVENDYRTEEAEKLFFELSDQLATLAYEHPDTLDIAAEQLDLEVQKSDFISRSPSNAVPALLKNPKIISAAFSEEVLQNGNNSDVIELDPNRIVVLRVTEHKPAEKKSLEAVHDEITDRIRLEKGRAKTAEIGAAILEKLKQGTSKDELSAEYSAEWRDANSVKRDDANINRSVLRTAFAMGHPDANQPLYGDVSMGSGDHAVVVVYAVHEPETVSDKETGPVSKQLQQLNARLAWLQLIKDLRDRAEIKVFEERL